MVYIGIDLAKATFTVTLLTTPQDLLVYGQTFDNTRSGFQRLFTLIGAHAAADACVIITENTGVYGEKLYYYCHRHGVKITMEPAHYIRRAFRLKRKTDPVDSRMIAEYGFRYADQLHPWEPPSPVVEQVSILLVNRAQIQKMKTASNNILKALAEKEHQGFTHTHQDAISFLAAQKTQIDKALRTALHTDPGISQHASNLLTLPGVGLNFCANFLVITDGYRTVDYRNLAGYLGICPLEHESGQTVYRRPRSDKKGPNRMRKQLYLSVMSALKHHTPYQEYFARQTAKGKPGSVIMNNLGNKLLRMACAIILTNRPYDPNYKSLRKFP